MAPVVVDAEVGSVEGGHRFHVVDGAGHGNASSGLLAAGADRVYAVTNDREDAHATLDRVDDRGRLAVLEADLRSVPLPDDSIELITAHGLCNVLDPATLSTVAAELTRVAAPGCHLVVTTTTRSPTTPPSGTSSPSRTPCRNSLAAAPR